ncbi:MAG: hypothetical protein A3G33_07695 [Omnitrophica bacterium RIFCSPLOWO2_12_FULL_44_17]|uniref:GDP-mannose pyrophosphatase n=1 Tax=Candidatus Danuiimicrobium aquiferis TaxID=1801832 RepID=A0A1G1L1T8_9BACT|nr:MAG: hypothetical protein A3B72_02250 [Omnitrophica bacterium RIFCSPHIGHO2_02_FULL_45_28]OGW99120.1 MAG: hypothetical protein A3G33_07695 [Omnitrophica bacterium RIFCSPLOWO2_12_FULL_44_17]OGX02615.1 MAG: hypothetical protein A3J12_01930 [Omnitrophica bacterium RIFCSPLOWO2_02_FULL_44_11]
MRVTKKILCNGKYRRFVSVNDWEFTERANCTGVVVILAMTDDQKVILVEQFRTPVGKPVIEFPAGLVGDGKKFDGESFDDAARRELLEETGYEAKGMIRFLEGPASAASVSDILTFYIAKGLKKVGVGGGDCDESITLYEVPLNRIEEWLEEQQKRDIWLDPRLYVGIYFLKKWNQIQ